MDRRLDDDRPIGLIITPVPELKPKEETIFTWFRKIFGL